MIPFTPSALQTSPAIRRNETQEGDDAMCIFLRVCRPHEVPHLAKTTTPGQSVEQRIATLLAAPGLAVSPLRARAHTWDAVACRDSRLPPTISAHAGFAYQLAVASLPRSRLQLSAVREIVL